MNAITDVRGNAGEQERLRIRTGAFTGPTSGLAPGNVQANLVILPKALAHDFLRFAQANPRPCPVLAVSEAGDPRFPTLGADLDIRTDLPRYRVWRNGELIAEPTDVRDVWRDDLVSFAIGCSFSFEEALIEAGIEVRHIARGTNVPMYRTNIPCVSGRRVQRAAGGVDAADEAGGRDPGGADHDAVSVGAWRAGASGVSRLDRDRRYRRNPTTATRCRSRPMRCRCSGPAA